MRHPTNMPYNRSCYSFIQKLQGYFYLSHRQIIVLLPRHLDMLILQHRQRAGEPPPRGVRHDDVVDSAALGGG
jgi:hypothetical protein